MGNFVRRIFGTFLFIGFLLSLTFCENEDHLQDTGELGISLTTNDIEEKGLESVIFTVKGIDVRSPYFGWIALRSFDEPVIVDMLKYQEGETFLLADNLLPAGIYTEIRLKLDMKSTYLLFQDGKKVDLGDGEGNYGEYNFKGGFKIPENQLTELILNWDLNRGIERSTVTDAFYLKPTLTSILRDEAATIKGKINLQTDNLPTKVYVVRSNDVNSTDDNDYEQDLLKAVNSSKVNADGAFIVPFLRRGKYNLIFIQSDEEGNKNVIRQYEEIELYSGEEKDLEFLSIEAS